jgi:glycosyltransferase involved in cell wall biosynthesis
MKILYLNPNGTVGGAEASLLHLLAGLRAAQPGWTLSLIAGSDGPLLSRAGSLGVSTRVVAFPPAIRQLGDASAEDPSRKKIMRQPAFLGRMVSGGIRVPAYISRLRQAIRDFGPNLVHSNGFKMHLLSACVAGANVPVVWHIHDYVRSRPVVAPLLRMFKSQCSSAVANSRSVAEDLRSICAPSLRIEAVHNGIDMDTFAPNGASLDIDAKAGLPRLKTGTIRVGLVSTFARWKGHDMFLRALAMLDPATSVRGYVIGGPIYQTIGSQYTLDELESLAEGLGLRGRVGFTGYIANAAEAIRSLDIIVHASTDPEPFGMVIVEAMACGKAVIVSDCGGASEIVQDRVNAIKYDPGNASALAAAIQELATSPQLRTRLGEAGRRTAEQRFNNRRFANDFVQIYRKLARGLN